MQRLFDRDLVADDPAVRVVNPPPASEKAFSVGIVHTCAPSLLHPHEHEID